MRVPAWTSAEVALKGVWCAAIGTVILISLGFAGVQTARLEGFKLGPISMTGWIETAKTAAAERDAEKGAHRKTKTDYRNAQAEAAELERQRLARVRREQQEISDAIEADYNARLADARARAERLRKELRTRDTATRKGGSLEVPGLSTAGDRAAAATADARLPAAERGSADQLERDLVATEQALQLDALIDWIIRQAEIDPNANAQPGQ
ncbi:hypothetical protein [Qipengyuania sp.]|uniref:hypothetical protein n=1 Tax=Qipengyuania sp. TaxID=2004515 RepID=UPI003511B09D